MQTNTKNKNITFAFILLIVVDVLAINYENGYTSIIGPIVKLIAYYFIIKEVVNKVKIKEVKKPIFIFLVVVVALNLFLVYQTVWTTFLKIEDYNESILYIIYGSINVLMCIIALNYHSRYSSKHSLYYLYFVFSLILSDASWFIAYYLNGHSAFYFDTLFYLISLCFIILYSENKNLNIEDYSLQDY